MNAISPQHYQKHQSGLECVEVVRDQTYLIGCTIKYLWRAGHKGDRLEDLQKSRQYLVWAIERGDEVHQSMAVFAYFEWHWNGKTDFRLDDTVIYHVLRRDFDEALIELDDLIEGSHD